MNTPKKRTLKSSDYQMIAHDLCNLNISIDLTENIFNDADRQSLRAIYTKAATAGEKLYGKESKENNNEGTIGNAQGAHSEIGTDDQVIAGHGEGDTLHGGEAEESEARVESGEGDLQNES